MNLPLRFLLAQALVVAVSLLVAVGVASLVGPQLFHDHLLMAGLEDPSTGLVHTERAYRDAGLITLGVALPTALLAALLVSLWFSRRLREPLRDLTRAASAMSDGDYDVRVTAGRAGPEVATLATAFNTMAGRLGDTEAVRRRMLSDLAHEMSTPVSVLAVYLDGLEDGVVDWGPSTHSVMSDQLTRLTRLVEDLDEVSRAEEKRLDLDLAEEPLGELLHVTALTAREAYGRKGVGLSVVPATGTVTVDHRRFQQILGNLLANALRHTPAGGRVTVDATRLGSDAVRIDVTDTGDGMTPAELEHVFERFYRGDAARSREHGGSGIGLTISRALADAHGGTLAATSPGPGRGSVFSLTLPLKP